MFITMLITSIMQQEVNEQSVQIHIIEQRKYLVTQVLQVDFLTLSFSN